MFDEAHPHFRGKNGETLEIEMFDKLIKLRVVLFYTVYSNSNLITRSVRFHNYGNEMISLEKVSSACIDFPSVRTGFPYFITHLAGNWARERQHISRKIELGFSGIESMRGVSSAQQNPFVVISEGHFSETFNKHYAIGLIYPSSFKANAELSQTGTLRVTIGIHPETFSWNLEPHKSFDSPEAVLVFSNSGMGSLSRDLHRQIKKNILPNHGTWKYNSKRPILVNTWESMYFNCSESKIITDLVIPGKKLGLDMVVLDDGWFVGRHDDTSSLGDWEVDPSKFPNGLGGFVKKVNDLEMKVGIWMEPEMISVRSKLYELHPDWPLHVRGRPNTESRNQLVLDLSREDVQDFIISSVSSILSSGNFEYLKWDFNRPMTEIGNEIGINQQEILHKYVLGLYRVLNIITKKFPNVLFESCAGGGNRFDLSLLYFTNQIWTSDNTDAVSRTKIQWGTSYFYPPATMGSHVSMVPNHQVNRVTPIFSRMAVAMSGIYGFELTLASLTENEQRKVEKSIALYKTFIEDLVLEGDLYRIESPFPSSDSSESHPLRVSSWSFVSTDKNRAVVFAILADYFAVANTGRLYPEGLNSKFEYVVKILQDNFDEVENELSGLTIMNGGLPLKMNRDAGTNIFIIERK